MAIASAAAVGVGSLRPEQDGATSTSTGTGELSLSLSLASRCVRACGINGLKFKSQEARQSSKSSVISINIKYLVSANSTNSRNSHYIGGKSHIYIHS